MTTQRFIITKDSAYAMVDKDSSEIDRVFSLAQAQTIRKFMASEEEWEQVEPDEAIRVEIILENNKMDTTYYCHNENFILLMERLFAKEKYSIMASLKIQEFGNMQEGENGNIH